MHNLTPINNPDNTHIHANTLNVCFILILHKISTMVLWSFSC